jgi:hypothetical protein
MRRTTPKDRFRVVLRDLLAALVIGGGLWLLLFSQGEWR